MKYLQMALYKRKIEEIDEIVAVLMPYKSMFYPISYVSYSIH